MKRKKPEEDKVQSALVFRPHDLRPEMYINRLGTTTQMFTAVDYRCQRSTFILEKEKKQVARKFLSHPVEVTGSMCFGNIF